MLASQATPCQHCQRERLGLKCKHYTCSSSAEKSSEAKWNWPSKWAREGMQTGFLVQLKISKNRRVTVRNWNGKVIVDIREFYVKDGKQMPGKKGISLPMDQWNVLRSHVDEIDKVVNETA